MPRKPRFNLLDIPQHVIQRGNNRQPCFYAEQDYQCYLSHLKEVAEKYHCQIHAYVLMTNHVHLLVTPLKEHAISQMMQALGRRYVRYFNQSYQRTGTLWEGRYKSSLIDSDVYLFRCMQYIELNPVRACMVGHPGEYRWSSYRINGQGDQDSLIKPHSLYHALAFCKEDRCFHYREMVHTQIRDDTLHDIRHTLNHELVLGSDYFKSRIKALTRRQVSLGKPGRPRVEEKQAQYVIG